MPEEYSRDNKDFRVLLQREVFKKPSKAVGVPPHLRIMKQLELVGLEDLSDHGHLRFYPKGALIMDLLADYLLEVVLEEGAYPVKSSPMYDLSVKAIKQHAELFGERLYLLKPEDRKFVLRYAACFGQFSILKNALISYRSLPLKLFELADSYRLEQSGEIGGLFRQRRFIIKDCYTTLSPMEPKNSTIIESSNIRYGPYVSVVSSDTVGNPGEEIFSVLSLAVGLALFTFLSQAQRSRRPLFRKN